MSFIKRRVHSGKVISTPDVTVAACSFVSEAIVMTWLLLTGCLVDFWPVLLLVIKPPTPICICLFTHTSLIHPLAISPTLGYTLCFLPAPMYLPIDTSASTCTHPSTYFFSLPTLSFLTGGDWLGFLRTWHSHTALRRQHDTFPFKCWREIIVTLLSQNNPFFILLRQLQPSLTRIHWVFIS